MNTADRYVSRYSKEAVHLGIKMKLIGHWIDLAAYYEGSDGNAWTWQPSLGWANDGPLLFFKSSFYQRRRGVLH